MNNSYKEESFAKSYSKALYDLFYDEDFNVSPRGLMVKEKLNVSIIFNPTSFLMKNDAKSSEIRYINGELEWYFKGLNDVDFISNYSKFWKRICNKDGSCNSAYGKLIFVNRNIYGFTQYSWALKQLLEDKDTRKAIMFFNNRDFQYNCNKDFVCTSYIIFFIRDNMLYMNVHMRSNDAILGTINDVAFFSMLHQQMFRHIREKYVDIKLGYYSHIIDSFHIYEDKFPLVDSMLKNDFTSTEYVLDYNIIDNKCNFLKFKSL